MEGGAEHVHLTDVVEADIVFSVGCRNNLHRVLGRCARQDGRFQQSGGHRFDESVVAVFHFHLLVKFRIGRLGGELHVVCLALLELHRWGYDPVVGIIVDAVHAHCRVLVGSAEVVHLAV